MNRKVAIAVVGVLIALVASTLFLANNLLSRPTQSREFFVGVEYAYGNDVSELKALVDKVANYTNLLVMGSVPLTFNRTALDEACDYIYDAGLHFIVFFTTVDMYSYDDFEWMQQAQVKYGDKFLGIYRFDEPGGNQIDKAIHQIVNESSSYSEAAQRYVGGLSGIVNYYLSHGAPQLFTADYALNWFDYQANYSAIFTEFVGNESRPRIIALNRGAAAAFDKDWGVIINWKYSNQTPYLESGDEMYSDLALAYSAGAKYACIFSYPNVTEYGTLTEDHFSALERFWNKLQSNPASFGSNPAQVAYVVPKDYGFGFRSPGDGIWGLFPPDNQSAKIYGDVELLTERYGSKLDILYDDQELIAPILANYSQVFYWNQTIPA